MRGRTLITNIRGVDYEGARMWANAVLIAPVDDGARISRVAQVRGFGTDGSDPTFSVWLSESDPEFEVNTPESVMGGIPLTRHLVIDGKTFTVGIEDWNKPISIEPVGDMEYEEIWALLRRRVAEHWAAPNMPVQEWHPADAVRAALARIEGNG